MAWKAIVTGWDLDAPSITYGYYDDTDPENTPDPTVFLHTQSFTRVDIDSNTNLQAAVVQAGKAKRKVYDRLKAIQDTGPVTIT